MVKRLDGHLRRYDDPTLMDVVIMGEIKQRKIDYVLVTNHIRQECPILESGEEVMHVLGSPPHIIRLDGVNNG